MLGEPKMPVAASVQESGVEKREKPETKIFFIRHSKASYATYAEKLASEEPETPIDIEAQLPDLPEAGIELTENSAREFFGRLDPQEDIIFIVSSSQMRALETAKIYVDIDQQMGFEVVEHQKAGTKIAERVGGGYVRSLDNLSLHLDSQVYGTVFNPQSQTPVVNWEKVAPETKAQFDQARAIVMADDKGSWGANFNAHAQAIKNFNPHMETPKELFQSQYTNLKRLAEFARTKAAGEKRVNVLAFGHENYMGYALEHDTREESIANTEAVELTEDGYLTRLEK